jgi:N utilization substance protein B
MTLLNDFSENSEQEFLEECGDELVSKLDKDYFNLVLSFVRSHREELDAAVTEASDNWKIQRISRVDLAILRLSIAEILYVPELPVNVSINEAVEMAKRFGSEKSPHFINGILGKIVRKQTDMDIRRNLRNEE